MAFLTAGDIAKHIQRHGEPLMAAVDRLRNWTKSGIIKPNGPIHPGTGRKKRYSSVELAQAILLQTLVDALGSSAASLQPLIRQITEAGPLVTTLAGYHERGWPGPELMIINHQNGRFRFDFCDFDNLRPRLSQGGNVHVILFHKYHNFFQHKQSSDHHSI